MKKLSTLLIFSCFTLFAMAQSWDGIVASTKVNDILETTSTVWMATDGGVVAVDKQTNAVSQLTKTTDGIIANEVEGITIDNSGNLWIGTYTMGLAKRTGPTWTAVPYPSSFPAMLTHSVRVDQNNVVWAGTSRGLVKYDGTNWELYNSTNTGLPFFHDAWNIEIDQQGNIYTASSGIVKYDGTTWTDITTGTGLTFYGDAPTEMLSDGTLVLGDPQGKKIGLYNGTTWTIYKSSNGDFPMTGFNTIEQDNNGNLYMAVKNYGVYKLQNGVWSLDVLPNVSIDKTNISTMFRDSNDDLWVSNNANFVKISNGTTTDININSSPIESNEVAKVYNENGHTFVLNNLNLNKYEASTGWSDITVPNNSPGLNTQLVNMIVTESGEYWISGTWTELQHWNGQNWITYDYTNSPLPLAVITDMDWDKANQTLWAATSSGIVKYQNQQWTVYTTSNTTLPDDDARQIEVHNGVVYTMINESIYSFDGTNWTNLMPNNTEYLSNLYIDASNNIWVGKWTSGVLKYENGTWNDITTLQNYKVKTMVEGANGIFYFGTETEGLVVLDGTNWSYFKENNSGLTHNNINHLSVDNNNSIWIATEGGISIYHPAPTVSNQEVITNEVQLNVFPNPIVSQAAIQFTLENSQNVRLGVYDVNGRLVQSILQNETQPAGEMIYHFSKENLVSGIYLIKLETSNQTQTVKVIVR